MVHLRRALLLFAIVLGLAAVAATLSRPSGDPAEPAVPPTEPAGAREPADVRFDVAHTRKRTIFAGQAAEVYVRVKMAGQAVIPGLGLSAAAEPLTPARFDVLVTRTGRYEVRFFPADETPDVKAGTLVVKEADPEV